MPRGLPRDGEIREIGRFVAGIAWPFQKPGFVVLVGEEKFPDTQDKNKFHVHVLQVVQHPDKDELIRMGMNMCQTVGLDHFRSRCDAQTADYLRVYNTKIKPPGSMALRVLQAPGTHVKEIAWHIDVIESGLVHGNRWLHWPEESGMTQRLQEIPADVSSLTAKDFPAVSALGYAVSYLVQYPAVPDDGEEKNEIDSYRVEEDSTMGLMSA